LFRRSYQGLQNGARPQADAGSAPVVADALG
jgi:hypothetical protein